MKQFLEPIHFGSPVLGKKPGASLGPAAIPGLYKTKRGTPTRPRDRVGGVFEPAEAAQEDTCNHLQVEDLPSLYRELVDKGTRFTHEPKVHGWGGMMVDFFDPHGNRLHFVQVLDREES